MTDTLARALSAIEAEARELNRRLPLLDVPHVYAAEVIALGVLSELERIRQRFDASRRKT